MGATASCCTERKKDITFTEDMIKQVDRLDEEADTIAVTSGAVSAEAVESIDEVVTKDADTVTVIQNPKDEAKEDIVADALAEEAIEAEANGSEPEAEQKDVAAPASKKKNNKKKGGKKK